MEDSNRPSVLKTVASYIIATEFCERLAYYGFAGSLVLFFETKLDMSNEDAINQFYLWNGAVYVTPLLGGYIADTILGRFMTILVFSVVYLIGLGLFLIGSLPTNIEPPLIFLGMYIVALGAGGIKPNCSTMGADQFDSNYDQDRKEAKLFFSYFYWSINLGALGAYTLVAYICQYGIPFLGGESWGFFVGYLIPTIVLSLGVLVFVSGSSRYKKNKPEGSIVVDVTKVVYEAGFKRRGENLNDLNTKLLNDESNNDNAETTSNYHWLDKASITNGGSFDPNLVESVKYVARLVPFLAVMIPYWGIYGQTKTAFQVQACQMDVDLNGFQLPISAMNIFNNVAILTLVPIFEIYLYPALKARGRELSMLQKIGCGFMIAMAAMFMAAIIENVRIQYNPANGNYYDQAARDNISPCKNIDNYNPFEYQDWVAGDTDTKPLNCWQTCSIEIDHRLSLECISCDDIPQMSHLSILWQIPQFVLIGLSEIFASITSLEFFYSQAPSNMRSVSQACNLFTNALGSWLTIPLTLLVNIDPNNEWVASNVNNGHLDYYFYLLAGLMFIALVVFTYLSSTYQYADPFVLESLTAAQMQHGETSGKGELDDEYQTGSRKSVEERSASVEKLRHSVYTSVLHEDTDEF